MIASSAEPKLDFPRSEYIQTLQRGLAVISAFDEANPRRTLSEVATVTGMTRAAARRFLLTLGALGYVESDGKYFQLLPKTLQIGYAYLASNPWWRHAQRVSERLAIKMQCPCAVAVLDRDSIAYVAYAPPVSMPNVTRSIGTRQPAYATAIGRVLLASKSDQELKKYLDNLSAQKLTPFTITSRGELLKIIGLARRDGYAIINQQLEIGLHSLGTPLRDRSGRIVAGISRSAGEAWTKRSDLSDVVRILELASAEITSGSPT